MENRVDRVEMFKDAADEWRWKRVAPNGEVIADSSEGYKNLTDCIEMAVRVNGSACSYPPPEPAR